MASVTNCDMATATSSTQDKADTAVEGSNEPAPSGLSEAEAKPGMSKLPDELLPAIFSDLDLSDIRNAKLVCQEWNSAIRDEAWRIHCHKRMSPDVISSEMLSSCPTYYSKLRAHAHRWSSLVCSINVHVRYDGFIMYRSDAYISTDGGRGRIGYNWGRHAWEISWKGPIGTVSVVGVATKQARMKGERYIPLIGNDDQSWGWDLVGNNLVHKGDSAENYPAEDMASQYQVGERIKLILNCEESTLSFEKNGTCLGVAFSDLPKGEVLYPAISTVYAHTAVSMVYLGPS